MNDGVRVRFAPSPTGFLHIGGARTALFNWLFARANGGKFLLRIEDTDTERSEARFTDDILASLKWLGFDWDEPPVHQSHRFDRYRAVAEGLLASGMAYRCECTPEELNRVRDQCLKAKKPFRYPGTCREKKLSAPGIPVRVRVKNEGETAFTDLIRGPISFQNRDIDDWVILRGNDSPTYNFSVVIDDSDQLVSHVLRGDDHINNTPKQILLYETLGLKVPHFAHLPMILGTDRAKLSKRHGAASTLEYRQMGYLPETMINFLVRLGWSHGDQEIFTTDELKQYFSLDHIGKANAVFSPDKLNWVSGQLMTRVSPGRLREYLHQYFASEIPFLDGVEAAVQEAGIGIIQSKVKNIPELIDQLRCLFGADPDYDVESLKAEEKLETMRILRHVQPKLEGVRFAHAELEAEVRAEAAKLELKLTPVAKALRYAVTGGKISPGLFEMLEIQGRERVLRRITRCLRSLTRE